jgi:hypothetical protein
MTSNVRYRVVRQFGDHIDPQDPRAYRVETTQAMIQADAVRLMRELNDSVNGTGDARSAIPDDIDPSHIRAMLHLLGPARMVLDRYAVIFEVRGETGNAREAQEMAQRIVDWIGHPVTDEPAWATLPCEQPDELTTEERDPGNPIRLVACRTCRPCVARMAAGYAPGLVDGAPVVDERPSRDANR